MLIYVIPIRIYKEQVYNIQITSYAMFCKHEIRTLMDLFFNQDVTNSLFILLITKPLGLVVCGLVWLQFKLPDKCMGHINKRKKKTEQL